MKLNIRLFVFFLVLTPFFLDAQKNDTKDKFEKAFDQLCSGKWTGEGKWGDGNQFKQQILIEKGSVGIYHVKTYGNTSAKPGKYKFGFRNEGIRAYETSSNKIKFIEFDVFGGITQGNVTLDGKNIFYTYEYTTSNGTIKLTDAWLFKNKNEYEFKVGKFENNIWEEVYLNASFKKTKK